MAYGASIELGIQYNNNNNTQTYAQWARNCKIGRYKNGTYTTGLRRLHKLIWLLPAQQMHSWLKYKSQRRSPPSNLRESFGSCQKSAQNRGCFWRAKSEKWGKTQKKISKIFIVPNRPLGHTDQLYTYKGYIENVGFTEKR